MHLENNDSIPRQQSRLLLESLAAIN